MGVSEHNPGASRKAAELRLAFDLAFAEPARSGSAAMEDFLAIRVGEDAYVLRLAEVASLSPLRSVTRLPTQVPALLGLMGFRGAIVPLYDLRVLLGYPARGTPRWTVIAAGTLLGLVFDAFDGHERHPPEASAQPAGATHARPHVREVLSSAGALRPVVSLESLLETIHNGAQHGVAQKER